MKADKPNKSNKFSKYLNNHKIVQKLGTNNQLKDEPLNKGYCYGSSEQCKGHISVTPEQFTIKSEEILDLGPNGVVYFYIYQNCNDDQFFSFTEFPADEGGTLGFTFQIEKMIESNVTFHFRTDESMQYTYVVPYGLDIYTDTAVYCPFVMSNSYTTTAITVPFYVFLEVNAHYLVNFMQACVFEGFVSIVGDIPHFTYDETAIQLQYLHPQTRELTNFSISPDLFYGGYNVDINPIAEPQSGFYHCVIDYNMKCNFSALVPTDIYFGYNTIIDLTFNWRVGKFLGYPDVPIISFHSASKSKILTAATYPLPFRLAIDSVCAYFEGLTGFDLTITGKNPNFATLYISDPTYGESGSAFQGYLKILLEKGQFLTIDDVIIDGAYSANSIGQIPEPLHPGTMLFEVLSAINLETFPADTLDSLEEMKAAGIEFEAAKMYSLFFVVGPYTSAQMKSPLVMAAGPYGETMRLLYMKSTKGFGLQYAGNFAGTDVDVPDCAFSLHFTFMQNESDENLPRRRIRLALPYVELSGYLHYPRQLNYSFWLVCDEVWDSDVIPDYSALVGQEAEVMRAAEFDCENWGTKMFSTNGFFSSRIGDYSFNPDVVGETTCGACADDAKKTCIKYKFNKEPKWVSRNATYKLTGGEISAIVIPYIALILLFAGYAVFVIFFKKQKVE